PTHIGLFAISVLAAAGLTLYFTHGNWEQPAARNPSPVMLQTPSPSSFSPRDSSPVASAPPSQVPVSGEKKQYDPPIVAIPVYPEFDRLLSNTRPGRQSKEVIAMHAKLERQARDPAWADEMEEALRKFYLETPELSRYGVSPQVDCRTSDCEVRMLAYADETTNWKQILISGKLEKPGSSAWSAEGFAAVTDLDERDGVTAIIVQV